MKTFEVAVPLQHCKKVTIEPSDEMGELMIVFKFPVNYVLLRATHNEIIKNMG